MQLCEIAFSMRIVYPINKSIQRYLTQLYRFIHICQVSITNNHKVMSVLGLMPFWGCWLRVNLTTCDCIYTLITFLSNANNCFSISGLSKLSVTIVLTTLMDASKPADICPNFV